MGVLDRDRVAGPVEQLSVVLAVADPERPRLRESEVLGEEREPRALRDLRVGELEEERERLRDEHARPEALLHLDLEPVEARRLADDDKLRGRLFEPVQQRAYRM